jgi:hypothetical protein
MRSGVSTWKRAAYVACALCAAHVYPAWAAGDEIQVYLDDVQPRGERGLELHMNYVPRGRTTPDYPGEQPPGHILRVTPEFSFGLGNNWDWGVYVPLTANKDTESTFSDYLKLRLKYLVNNERLNASEFYGVNFELGRSPLRVSPSAWHGEIRTILGMRRGDWLFAMNPILDVPLSTSVADNKVGFELGFKVAKNVGGGLALGVEHYADLGPVRRLTFGSQSAQTTFAVLDYEAKSWDINFGVGRGWTEGADRTVVKAILGLPF